MRFEFYRNPLDGFTKFEAKRGRVGPSKRKDIVHCYFTAGWPALLAIFFLSIPKPRA